MRTHIVSSTLSATALLLLASSPAAAQYEVTRWHFDASSWSCERPFLGGTWSPVYCRNDEQPDFVVVEERHDDSDDHMKHCKIRTVLAHLHGGKEMSRPEGSAKSWSYGENSWSHDISSSTSFGGGGRSGEGRQSLGNAVSDAVSGLLP